MLTGLGYNFSADRKSNLVSLITSSLLKFSLINKNGLRIILQNADDYKTLIAHRIISQEHQSFIVNGSGVDLDHYYYTVPKTKIIQFLMISRLINAKGVKEFYDAAIILKKKYTGIQFNLIGAYDDNIDAISADLFRKIKSNEVIQYLGEVDDVRPYIQAAAVVVLPSYYGEGIPRCLLEAMAMGRTIITCDSVGCRETISTSGNINGFLVPKRDVNSLVVKMEQLINDKELITTYGLNGLAFARERFDVKHINKQMMNIMQLD